MTEFEKRLKEFFPEIYELHLLGKTEDNGGLGEEHLWTVINQLLMLRKNKASGAVIIGYSNGKISNLEVKINILNGKAKPSIDNDRKGSV